MPALSQTIYFEELLLALKALKKSFPKTTLHWCMQIKAEETCKNIREISLLPSPSLSGISFLFHSNHKWLWQINSPGLFALLSQSRLLAQQNEISSHSVSFIKAMEINGIQRSHLQHCESRRLHKPYNLAHHWHVTSIGLSLPPWYGCCR